jgi:hypothetical protein
VGEKVPDLAEAEVRHAVVPANSRPWPTSFHDSSAFLNSAHFLCSELTAMACRTVRRCRPSRGRRRQHSRGIRGHDNGACACACGLHQEEHSSRSNRTAEARRSARSMWWLDACSSAASSWICTDMSWSDFTNSDIFQDTTDTFEPQIDVQSADFGSTSTQKNNQYC